MQIDKNANQPASPC